MPVDGRWLMQRQAMMESRRTNFESIWREIIDYVHPHHARINPYEVTNGGERKFNRQFDGTAPLALDRFAAAMESMLVPRGQRWHGLTPVDRKLAKDRQVMRYLDDVNEVLFDCRYAAKSGFPEATNEVFRSEGSMGTGCMFVDEEPGLGLRYRAISIGEIWVDFDAWGRVDSVHRKFRRTLRQMAQEYGRENLPARLLPKLENSPDSEEMVLHCIRPNTEMQWDRMDWQGMPYMAVDVLADGAGGTNDILRKSGYRTMPYMVPAYSRMPGEWYGRSPAMMCLGDIRTLNKMRELWLKGLHYAVAPPLLASDLAQLTPLSMLPGAINPGMVSPDGRPLVMPMFQGGDLRSPQLAIEDCRQIINACFLITLFQILVDKPNMTATEATYRAEEKGQLLAPAAGRQYSELFGPMIERELDILAMAGQLPEMPPILQDRGGELPYQIRYESPIMRMQRAEQASAVLGVYQGIAPIAQIDPTVLDKLDHSQAVEVLAYAAGMPASVLRSDEALAALQDERATNQQAIQSLQAAQVAGGVARDLSASAAAQGRAAF